MSDPPDNTDVQLHGFPSTPDGERIAARDRLEVIASRYADEVRRGLRPSIEEYCRRYWQLADEIRELFPLVASLERWKDDKESECVRQGLPAELPFRELGPWKLIREIGRGGMGVVFEGLNSGGKRVAIKLLPWRFTADAPRRKAQLKREADTIAALRHKNIVPVLSHGEHEGFGYYVMRLVNGVSLAWLIDRLRSSPDPVQSTEVHSQGTSSLFPIARDSWTTFSRIGVQVAMALEYAHERQVFHHDVKPGNLLLDVSGQVLLSDFGVGPVPAEDYLEPEESGLGTVRYMAPERMKTTGNARSDIYSLGVTLYELATQTSAFEAPDRGELFSRILEGRFPPPRQVAKTLPQDLETIVLTAMSLDPADRYPTARALAADLFRFTKGQPINAHRPGFLRKAVGRYIRRFGRDSGTA
jgi:serine/threonine protein kinase